MSQNPTREILVPLEGMVQTHLTTVTPAIRMSVTPQDKVNEKLLIAGPGVDVVEEVDRPALRRPL